MAVRLVRVIGGRFRGRRLRAPRGPGTRPATGRVRESVFSTLGATVEGARTADLYAGSGSFGFEALSRGGDTAVFVERSRPALRALRSNVRSLGVEHAVRVVPGNVEHYVGRHRDGPGFDIVFADPPWDISSEKLALVLERFVDRMNPDAQVVVTRRTGDGIPVVDGLEVIDQRRRGDTEIIRYVKE